MRIYVDASVIVALVTGEATAIALDDWLALHADEQIASDFGRGELVAALRAKERQQHISASDVRDFHLAGEAWLANGVELETSPADIARATNYLLRSILPLRLPDAIHIALAARAGAALATLDRQQLRAAVALGERAIDPLAEETVG